MATEVKADEIPELAAALQQARSGDLNGAVERLLLVEKKHRTAGDALLTSKVAVQIVKLCFEMGDLKALNAQVQVLAKRRGQLKQVISDVVTEAMKFIEQVPRNEDKAELISTLRTITEGKMYVELERARLTMQLAKLQEAEGRVAEASETLQEIPVETVGSMERREKGEFILEQMRLTLLNRDFVRMGILAGKLNKRALDEKGAEDQRLRYFDLVSQLHQYRRDAFALANDYYSVYTTRGLTDEDADPIKWQSALSSVCVYLSLAPWDNATSDMVHRVLLDPRLDQLSAYKALLTALTTQEVAAWPLQLTINDNDGRSGFQTLMAHGAFQLPAPPAPVTASVARAGGNGMDVDADGAGAPTAGSRSSRRVQLSLITREDEDFVPWGDILRKRIAQHNVRVLAHWYDRVSFARLSQLLGLDGPTAEMVISELVATDKREGAGAGSSSVWARIDRPASVVTFMRARPAAEVLGEWSSGLGSVLGLVEKVSHLIQKEYMLHGIKAKPVTA